MEGLLAGAPPGTKAFCSESGWINTEIFNQWLHFFVERVRPTANSPVLLIVDNHVSHKSIEALDYASENNVVILSVPPHTTHKLQPLDRCVYGPLKSAYEKTVTSWQKRNPNMSITMFQVAAIFNEAYTSAATIKNAMSAFEACGIHPYNRDIFTDEDFAPAEVTDRPEPEEEDQA